MTIEALPREDRSLWLRLPSSAWIWIYGLMVASLLEDAIDQENEQWKPGEAPLSHEDLVHQGRTLLAIREVIEQSVPPQSYWDAVKGWDELQAELFARWNYTPTSSDRAFVRDLVVDPDRDYPVALERLRKAMQEELNRPRSA